MRPLALRLSALDVVRALARASQSLTDALTVADVMEPIEQAPRLQVGFTVRDLLQDRSYHDYLYIIDIYDDDMHMYSSSCVIVIIVLYDNIYLDVLYSYLISRHICKVYEEVIAM